MMVLVLFSSFSSQVYSLDNSSAIEGTLGSQASLMITRFERDISDLDEQGFSTVRLDDTLADMKFSFAEDDFDRVAYLYAQGKSFASKIVSLSKRLEDISVLSSVAAELELDDVDALVLFNAAKMSLDNNDFDACESKADESYALFISLLQPRYDEILVSFDRMFDGFSGYSFSSPAQDYVDSVLDQVDAARAKDDFVSVLMLSSEIYHLNVSLYSIASLDDAVITLESEGYPVVRFRDALSEMEVLLSEGEHAALMERFNSSMKLLLKIKPVESIIDEVNLSLHGPEFDGIDVSEASSLLGLSIEEFTLENYEKSEEYAFLARDAVQELRSEYLLQSILNRANAKFDFLGFLRSNWLALIIWLFFIGFFVWVIMFMLRTIFLNKRLEKLSSEETALVDMVKQLQLDYYRDHIVDKDSFVRNSKEFEKRQEELSEEISLAKQALEAVALKYRNLKDSVFGIFGRLHRSKDGSVPKEDAKGLKR